MNKPLPIAAAALALALAPSVATDDATEPTYTPEGVVTVAACYSACASEYAERANRAIREFHAQASHHAGRDRCRVWRNVISAARICETGCNSSWSALHKPPSKIRDKFRGILDADETAYAGYTACQKSNLALSEGLKML